MSQSPESRRAWLVFRLLVGAAFFVVLAMWATRPRAATEHAAGTPFLPELRARAEQIERIEITQGVRAVRLARQDGAWVVESAGGYPAKFEAVKGLVSALAALQVDEAMTARKERHAELGLAWPDPSGKARLVTLSGGGDPLEIVLGEERMTPKGQYARRLGEDQTYRCRNIVTCDLESRSWMDTELVNLPPDETLGVTFMGLEVKRGEGGAWTATPTATPVEWTEAQQNAAKTALPSWLTRLEFDDVRPRASTEVESGLVPDPAFTFDVDTVHAIVHVEGHEENGATWVRLRAEPKPDAPPMPAPDPAAEIHPGMPVVPDWNAWNAKVAPWEFRLPEWKRSAIARIREAKAPAPAPPGTPPIQFPR